MQKHCPAAVGSRAWSTLHYSHYVFPNHNKAVFAEDIFRVTPRWNVIPGVRYEQISTRAQGNYTNVVLDLLGIRRNMGIFSFDLSLFLINYLSAEYLLNRNFSLQGSLNNFTDTKYFTRRADSYPGPGIVPSDARSFFLTLQARF